MRPSRRIARRRGSSRRRRGPRRGRRWPTSARGWGCSLRPRQARGGPRGPPPCAGRAGADGRSRRDLADTVNRIGRTLSNMGRLKEAEATYRDALEIRRRVADESPDDLELRSDLAASHNNLGYLLRQTGRPREAEAELRSAMELWKQTADAYPAVAGSAPARQGDVQPGRSCWRRPAGPRTPRPSIAGRSRSIPTGRRATRPPRVRRRRGARASSPRARPERDRPARRGGGRAPDVDGPPGAPIRENPAVPEYRVRLASTHDALAILLAESGRMADAEATFRAELAINRRSSRRTPASAGTSTTWRPITSTSASCCRTPGGHRTPSPNTPRRRRSSGSSPTPARP